MIRIFSGRIEFSLKEEKISSLRHGFSFFSCTYHPRYFGPFYFAETNMRSINTNTEQEFVSRDGFSCGREKIVNYNIEAGSILFRFVIGKN